MHSFRKSLAALAVLLVIAAVVAALTPLVSRGQGGSGQAPPLRDPRKSYYLTQTLHAGSQALSACAEGYHMASLWEIFDTSNLRYDTQLGHTLSDSGFGPPTDANGIGGVGWIRTGNAASGDPQPGWGNCKAWTSAGGGDSGTTVALNGVWSSTVVHRVSPWFAQTHQCDTSLRAWCVQD